MAWKKDYNEIPEEEKIGSRINAAGIINSTLEKLWNQAYDAMSSGNYHTWNTRLDAIWAILGGDEPEKGDAEIKVNNINLKIYEQGSLHSKSGQGFEKKDNTNNPLQYQWLLKKSLYLRRLQNTQGKGTAYASTDEDEID